MGSLPLAQSEILAGEGVKQINMYVVKFDMEMFVQAINELAITDPWIEYAVHQIRSY